MKKQINKSLLKSIINSDFFILNKDISTTNIYLDKKTLVNKSKNLNSLNLFELLKSLKQFIRLIQFIKNKDNAFLYISIENKQHYFLFKQFLSLNKLDINVKVFNSFNQKKNSSLEHIKVFLILGSNLFINNKQLLKNLNVEKIFLFSRINTNLEQNNSGVYKIFNDLFDFKKIIFLILLINQVLKKK